MKRLHRFHAGCFQLIECLPQLGGMRFYALQMGMRRLAQGTDGNLIPQGFENGNHGVYCPDGFVMVVHNNIADGTSRGAVSPPFFSAGS